jgi:glycosyltransferase involved in cell wall biosynthesis
MRHDHASELRMSAVTTPLRCTHVITGLGTGGAERMLQKLISATEGSALCNEVVSLGTGGPIGEELAASGIAVHTLGLRPDLSSFAAVPQLRRTIEASHADVVQAWMYHANLLTGLAMRGNRSTPLLWNIRASTLERAEKLPTRLIARGSAIVARSLTRGIVTNSHTARDVHVAMGYPADRFQVIPNGFDLARFRPDVDARAALRRELRIPERDPVIGIVARNHPMKDFPSFLSAAAEVARGHSNVHFMLAGDGVGREDPLMAAAAEQLGDRLHLLGPRADVPRVMASLDVYASTSSYGEAFPNVLGEAMAAGVPCVATDVGDSARIIDVTGFVVPPKQPESMAAAWARMLAMDEHERRHLGMRARERIEAHYSLQSVALQYVRLYASVSGAGSSVA